LSLFLAVLVVDVGTPVSYISFAGDYNALNASKKLEITRCMIYNYLVGIGLDIISIITIYPGKIDFYHSKVDINTFVCLF
jgi:hypothetical protein